MFAQVETVIAPENDDGVPGQAKSIEFIQSPTHLRIQKADAGEVTVTEFSHQIG